MPDFTSVYKVSSGTAAAGSGDAFTLLGGGFAMNDVATNAPMGKWNESFSKAGVASRFDLHDPLTGPEFNLDFGVVTGVRWTFQIAFAGIVQQLFGFFHVGILDPGRGALWPDPANCFSQSAYPLYESMPAATDANDVIRVGSLLGDAFMTEGIAFVYQGAGPTPIDSIWTIGEFSLGQNYPTTNAVAEMNRCIALPEVQEHAAVGIVLDPYDLPQLGLERFWIYESFNTGHTYDGMQMELEWEMNVSLSLGGVAVGSDVVATSTAEPGVTAADTDTAPVIDGIGDAAPAVGLRAVDSGPVVVASSEIKEGEI